MALLAIMEFEGGTIGEYEQINEVIGVHSANDAPDGLIRHVAGTSDDGLVIIDLWDSPEAMEAFYEGRLAPALAQLDDPPQAEPRVVPVHNHLTGSGETAGVIMIAEIADLGTDDYDRMVGSVPAHAGDGSGHPSFAHVAATTDDGMLIVDIWESPEAFARFADEQIGPAAADIGMTGFAPRFVPVHNHIKGGAGG
jgi:hypothetical protein